MPFPASLAREGWKTLSDLRIHAQRVTSDLVLPPRLAHDPKVGRRISQNTSDVSLLSADCACNSFASDILRERAAAAERVSVDSGAHSVQADFGRPASD